MANKIDIPNGWEVKKLGEVCDVRDGTHESPKFVNNGFPLLTSKNIINGKLDFTNINYITEKDFININRRSKVDNGDILMAMIGTIGNAVIINTNKEFAIKNVALLKFYENKSFNKFIYYLLSSQYYAKQVHQSIKGGTQKFYALGDIRNTNIPVPPLAEQEKIAEILSLWDKAIEHIKELIAYKEKQKKGLMQNLLTGKKRLHGFNDKWKTYIVKELGLVITGKTPNTEKNEYYGDEFLFITPTDIHYKYTTKTERNLSKSGLNKSKLIPKNSVLITCIASIGKNTINKSDCAINQQINAIVPNNNFYYEYIYYYMTFNSPYLLKFAGKSATSIINKTTFEEIDVTIPPLDEQKAIADILCKADEEIELLNKQLDLYTEQKKGLMQNLLTGKVRVTV